MAPFSWDRLLQTALGRGGDLIVTVGSSPIIYWSAGLQSVQLPPLSATDFEAALREMNSESESSPYGVRTSFVRHGDTIFQVSMLGEPMIHTLFITPMPSERDNNTNVAFDENF